MTATVPLDCATSAQLELHPMKRYLVAFAVLLGGCLALGEAVATHIAEKDLPEAVRQAVKKEVPPEAQFIGYEKMAVDGEVFFEVKVAVSGKNFERLYRPDGRIVVIEEETALENIPAPAQAAIRQAAGRGKVRKVDIYTENGRVSYEGELLVDGQKRKVRFDAKGKAIQ